MKFFQSPCCELQLDRLKAGGCTVHARRCGGDNGIFLRLRKCQVILLSDVKRGKYLSSGESLKLIFDMSIIQGNPNQRCPIQMFSQFFNTLRRSSTCSIRRRIW